MLVLGYALAALIGLSLGLMGGGGSILTVPIFVYVLGYETKLAIAMSLPVVAVTSMVGAISHARSGNVNLRSALGFGVVAMVGAFLGARVGLLLSGAVQLTILGVVMLCAAAFMFRSPIANEHTVDARSPAFLAAVALPVGAMTGIVGVGGGFLIVPSLVILARIPMKQAVGTSLVVIALNCASGFAGYLGEIDVPVAFLTGFTAVAVVGILVGTYLVRFVSQQALKRAFAVFLVVMGIFILVKNRAAFATRSPASSSHRQEQPGA